MAGEGFCKPEGSGSNRAYGEFDFAFSSRGLSVCSVDIVLLGAWFWSFGRSFYKGYLGGIGGAFS